MPYWASLITALTIVQTATHFGKELSQKWINDLFFEGKKVGGILCESSNAPNGGFYLSIGVGINLTNCPDDCSKLEGVNREDLFWTLAKNLDKNIRQADKDGPAKLFGQMKFMFLNEKVAIMDHTLTEVLHEGVFIGINEYGHAKLKKDGSLFIVEVSQGRMRKL